MPDTNITFTRVEPGWWSASTGETIVRRPFTGWQDDPTFPWVTFDAGKPATFRNRGPAFATLAEAKDRVRSWHTPT